MGRRVVGALRPRWMGRRNNPFCLRPCTCPKAYPPHLGKGARSHTGSAIVPLGCVCNGAAVSTPPAAVIITAWGAVRAPVRWGWSCKPRYTHGRSWVGGGTASRRGCFCASTFQAKVAVMGHRVHAFMVMGGNGEGLAVSSVLAVRAIGIGSFRSSGLRAVSGLESEFAIHSCCRYSCLCSSGECGWA